MLERREERGCVEREREKQREENMNTYISVIDDIALPPSREDNGLIILIIIVIVFLDFFLFLLERRVRRFAFTFTLGIGYISQYGEEKGEMTMYLRLLFA